jgi:dGTPase
MEYKTQVFLPHEADHFRTRLTHSIEVAQIGRTIARNLRLNEDLTEAIALVHDLGHPPFGHAGENVLDDLLGDVGGFNHNLQSLRVVDLLEQRYPEHPGLNLTYEVREGIAKHETSITIAHPNFGSDPSPTLEASLVDMADEIAYNAHDIDDGLSSGLITLDELRNLSIWKDNGLEAIFEGTGEQADDQKRYALVRYLVNILASDLLTETSQQLETLGITDLISIRACREKICRYSEETALKARELKEWLMLHLYQHPHLRQASDRARQIIETLFEQLRKDETGLPNRFREMLLTEDKEIVIADYIAGMTDRYAERLYEKGRC